MEAYVHGVSMRKVDDLVAALGIDVGISKSEVSRICAELDVVVASRRDRSLGHAKFPTCSSTGSCATRRGSSRVGKNEPVRSFGMRSLTSPALVLSRRPRAPLRWVVRSSVRSYRSAPIAWEASSSISARTSFDGPRPGAPRA
jgi:hypothetical protein